MLGAGRGFPVQPLLPAQRRGRAGAARKGRAGAERGRGRRRSEWGKGESGHGGGERGTERCRGTDVRGVGACRGVGEWACGAAGAVRALGIDEGVGSVQAGIEGDGT